MRGKEFLNERTSLLSSSLEGSDLVFGALAVWVITRTEIAGIPVNPFRYAAI
jgi:hypothetical protein